MQAPNTALPKHMPHIPASVIEKQPLIPGLNLIHRGKVRDSYGLPGHQDKMLVVASDRCSIFDFVLPTLIPLKGQILTALNHFWTNQVLPGICQTDFIAAGSRIDEFLPEALWNNPELQKRAAVVRIVPSPDIEDIVRLYLTGNGWKSYKENGMAFEYPLPKGLFDGNKLPYPLYTPTTKAVVGHDKSIPADTVAKRDGARRERLSLQVAGAISAHAAKCGIILADSKFEFSVDTFRSGEIILADEKGTPDSSRFWDAKAWAKAQAKGKLPPSFDKQHVREWGKSVGVTDGLDPENPTDLAFVDGLEVWPSVIDMTTRIYRYISWRLTDMQIERYQSQKLGINVEAPKRRIEIVVGSESDLPQVHEGMVLLGGVSSANISVISCHRNPTELRKFVKDVLTKADIVIAGAGMAAALPGIVKSELCLLDHPEIPVIGVAFEGATEKDNLAAQLSIECLPGSPVELDENDKAYFGHEGFLGACRAAVHHEFLPKMIEAKPAKIGTK